MDRYGFLVLTHMDLHDENTYIKHAGYVLRTISF